jgi:DNA repair protein RecO (recombination protein O)
VAAGSFLILRTMVFKEADLQIDALNAKGGKQHFLARSALKSKKRFGGGVLEAMNYVHLTYEDRKEKAEFVALSEAKLIDGFSGIRSDYDRLQLGLSLAKDVSRITVQGSDDNGPIFNLFGNALKKLEHTKEIRLLQLHFRIKLLFYSGYLPNEDGHFNEFLHEPLQNCEKLKGHKLQSQLRSLSDHALRELGVF